MGQLKAVSYTHGNGYGHKLKSKILFTLPWTKGQKLRIYVPFNSQGHIRTGTISASHILSSAGFEFITTEVTVIK